MIADPVKIPKKLTLEEYLELPRIYGRWEVIDGELRMTPAPKVGHALIIINIVNRLFPFVKKKAIGAVLSAPVDVLIKRKPLRMRQPDILYISRERLGDLSLKRLMEMNYLENGPELVLEVLSPREPRAIKAEKIADYQKVGVQECLLVSPEAQTVGVLRWSAESAKTMSILGIGETVKTKLLPGFELKVADIFAD